ncbi:hypothetical protein MP228_011935 [Amoeboaphelidium protococcarum]|nr:hypothetical protein MP228_011935 [Amoeboaphelidium protococcarum]
MKLISQGVILLVIAIFSQVVYGYTTGYKANKLVKDLNARIKSQGKYTLKVNSHAYDMFTESPRNYSLVLLITATDPQVKCQPCILFAPEFELAAKSWYLTHSRASAEPNPLYFGVVDYSYAKEVFQKNKIETVPSVQYLPPTEGDNKQPDGVVQSYQIKSFDAEDFANWVGRVSSHGFMIQKPVDYTIYIVVPVVIVALGAFIKVVGPQLSSAAAQILTNRHIYMSASILFIISMCSGTMWNSIRGAPYAGRGQNGQMELFNGNFQAQYQVESQIITCLYAALAACMVMFSKRVPLIKDASQQRLAVYILLGVFFFLYSALMAIFRMKNGGYPFKLFL